MFQGTTTGSPMLTLLEDTCSCVYCMPFAACDKHRYRQLGAVGHDSCRDNLKMELSKGASLLRTSSTGCFDPALTLASRAAGRWLLDSLNLFVNVPVTTLEEGKSGELRLAAQTCPRGGYAMLRAEVECVVAMKCLSHRYGPGWCL
jgi:uncharacterized protein